jgi:hypothetical protein
MITPAQAVCVGIGEGIVAHEEQIKVLTSYIDSAISKAFKDLSDATLPILINVPYGYYFLTILDTVLQYRKAGWHVTYHLNSGTNSTSKCRYYLIFDLTEQAYPAHA